MGVFYTFEGAKFFGLNATSQQGLFSFNAVASFGSPLLSGVSSYSSLAVGQFIVSPVLPPGTYIVDLDGVSGTITLSQPANATTPSGQTSYFAAGGMYTLNSPLHVHLATGQLILTSDATVANLTEADYDGYAPQEAVGPAIINTPPPRTFYAWQFERMVFQPTDYTVQNTITGMFWTYTPSGSSAPILLAIEPFSMSASLMQDGDIVSVSPTLFFAFDQTAGPASPGLL